MPLTTSTQRPFARAVPHPWIGLAVVFWAACSDDPPTGGNDGTDASAALGDVGANDISAAQDVIASEDAGLDCPGGAGCPCKGASECDNNLCLETPDGHRCARNCVDACPDDGFTCKPLTLGGDTVTVCMPTWLRVCDPCQQTADCQSSGLSAGHCVRYGDAGSFCGANCQSNGDCPIGSRCAAVTTTEGKQLQQCVRVGKADGAFYGACSCSQAAIDRGADTTCTYPDKDDVKLECSGQRVCTETVLAPCATPDDSAPVCFDAQCKEKLAGAPCDDGDVCTSDGVCSGGVCTGGANICACLKDADCPDDGDLCNGVSYCDTSTKPTTCKPNPGSVVVCNTASDTHCAKTACIIATGKCVLEHIGAGTVCQDGNPCTQSDTCDGKGGCQPGVDTCPCKQDSDCKAKDDGDICNGTLYCDKTAAASTCKVNPATVVKCPSVNDTDCSKNLCQPQTGLCGPAFVPENSACDDENPCSTADHCVAGKCEGGANTCVCKTHADCASKDDGDKCNGVPYCDKTTGKCEPNPATAVVCPSVADTDCAHNACDKSTGECVVKALNDGGGCNDGNPCTKGEICAKGECGEGTSTCKCADNADCQKFEDANPCNGTLYCHKASGACLVEPTTIIQCDKADPKACTLPVCDVGSATCKTTDKKDGSSCDDDNICTINDACKGGQCAVGSSVCPCQQDADCDKHDDGDKCNGVKVCDLTAGTCVFNPATVVTCKTVDDDKCHKNICEPKSGKCAAQNLPDGTACDDGDACSKASGCVGGACTADGKSGCDDGNTCTTDVCDKQAGCQNTPNTIACPDDDACTTDEVCEAGSCKTKGKKCNDANPCTQDTCAPATQSGCVYNNLSDGPCDDGDACSQASSCIGGTCTASKTKVCDDNNGCTDDSCDKQKGCQFTPNTAKCPDSEPCTTAETCAAGKCVTKPLVCDDKDPCTTDLCASGQGCVKLPASGKACDDGNVCTTASTCSSGKCVGTKNLVCKDGLLCTNDTCDAKKGCVFPYNTVACDDGQPCTIGDKCKSGKCAAGTTKGKWYRDYVYGNGHLDLIGAHAAATPGQYLLAGAITPSSNNVSSAWVVRVNASLDNIGAATSSPPMNVIATSRSKGRAWVAGYSTSGGKDKGQVARFDLNGAYQGSTATGAEIRFTALAPTPTCDCTIAAGPYMVSKKDMYVYRITETGAVSWVKKMFTAIAHDVTGFAVWNNTFIYGVDLGIYHRAWSKKSDWSSIAHTEVKWSGSLAGRGLAIAETTRLLLPGSYVSGGIRRAAFAEFKPGATSPTYTATTGNKHAHFHGMAHSTIGTNNYLAVGWEQQGSAVSTRRPLVHRRNNGIDKTQIYKTLPINDHIELRGATVYDGSNWLVVGTDYGTSRRKAWVGVIDLFTGSPSCK